MNNDFEWSSYISEALESTKYLALATSDGDHIWASPVFFGYDSDLNLYFSSISATRHMQSIVMNPEVACAVYASEQIRGQIHGLQMRGTVALVEDDNLAAAVKHYFYRLAGKEASAAQIADFAGPSAEFKLVKIEPVEIGYFDQRYFGESRQIVPLGIKL